MYFFSYKINNKTNKTSLINELKNFGNIMVTIRLSNFFFIVPEAEPLRN
jgi:hypothetical protein